MQVTVKQSELSQALQIANRAIPSKPTHPILTNLLIETKDKKLSISSFDMSLGISVDVDCDVKEEGRLCVPSKLISDIVSKFPSGNITLSLEDVEDGKNLILKGKSKYHIRVVDPAEYPELPSVGSTPIDISKNALIEGLKGTLFAASQEESKQILVGVNISISPTSGINFGSTDGHRLAWVNTEYEGDDSAVLTIPARSLQELLKMLSLCDEDFVSFQMDEGLAIFKWDGYKLSTRILEGAFPAYQSLIPKQFERTVTTDKKELIAILDRLSVISERTGVIVMTLSNESQELLFYGESKDSGMGYESLTAQISGENVDVAFNVKYLLEGLKSIPGNEVSIHLNQPLSPVIFKPIGGMKMVYLTMPVQLKVS